MRRNGFTLLEILVSTGIFMVIMVVSIGVFTLTVGGSSSVEQMRITTQSARFAFESIAREIKLAKGLVYAKNNVPILLVPPFDVQQDTQSGEYSIRVYQAKKVGISNDGATLFTLTRRTYVRLPDKKLVLRIDKAYDGAEALSGEEIFKVISSSLQANKLDSLPWRLQGDARSAILPNSYSADKFLVTRSYGYPASGERIDAVTQQPFVQLELTILSSAYNKNKDTEKQIKTTLRTMIVPRSFDSPLEVIQPKIQATQ